MKRIISLTLIAIGFIGLLGILFINYFQLQVNQQIINNFARREYGKNSYYVGYIEVCSIRIPLVYGTSDKELNQNVVGINNHSTKEHLILAGHAVKSVFLCLHKINIDDEIKIKFHDSNIMYYIDYKIVVKDTDISVYSNTGLTLITCLDKYRRLIVHAKTAN